MKITHHQIAIVINNPELFCIIDIPKFRLWALCIHIPELPTVLGIFLIVCSYKWRKTGTWKIFHQSLRISNECQYSIWVLHSDSSVKKKFQFFLSDWSRSVLYRKKKTVGIHNPLPQNNNMMMLLRSLIRNLKNPEQMTSILSKFGFLKQKKKTKRISVREVSFSPSFRFVSCGEY